MFKTIEIRNDKTINDCCCNWRNSYENKMTKIKEEEINEKINKLFQKVEKIEKKYNTLLPRYKDDVLTLQKELYKIINSSFKEIQLKHLELRIKERKKSLKATKQRFKIANLIFETEFPQFDKEKFLAFMDENEQKILGTMLCQTNELIKNLKKEIEINLKNLIQINEIKRARTNEVEGVILNIDAAFANFVEYLEKTVFEISTELDYLNFISRKSENTQNIKTFNEIWQNIDEKKKERATLIEKRNVISKKYKGEPESEEFLESLENELDNTNDEIINEDKVVSKIKDEMYDKAKIVESILNELNKLSNKITSFENLILFKVKNELFCCQN